MNPKLFIQEIKSQFGLESLSKVTILQGSDCVGKHTAPFSSGLPALIYDLEGMDSHLIQKVLLPVYPPDFFIKTMDFTGSITEIYLKELLVDNVQCIYIPALGIGTSFVEFQEMIAHLRAPEDGCPWDKEQTHLSLRKHLLEESYETISAMDEEDTKKMAEEFGDLLLQVVLNAQIGSENKTFTMEDILHEIYNKILRRHPHVFAEVKVEGVSEVLSNWEKIKAGERKTNGEEHKGILDGLPAALPSLTLAQEYQDRAARVGFDWPEIEGVLAKIREEIEEVKIASNMVELSDEIGDLFFALVNLARWKKIDSESALREANLKFKRRFKYIENKAAQSSRTVQSMNLQELDALWNEAKIYYKNNAPLDSVSNSAQ